MGWHEDKIYELEQETKKARQETEKFQAQEHLLVAERELMVTRSTDGLFEAEAQRRQALDLKRLELWGHALPYLEDDGLLSTRTLQVQEGTRRDVRVP